MQTKISKWGNSLGVRIPKGLAEEAGLGAGDDVLVTATAEGLSIRRRSPRPRYSLERLVAGITDENRHEEVDWGPPRGKEIW